MKKIYLLLVLIFWDSSIFAVTAVDSGSKALEFLGLNDQDDQSTIAEAPSVSPNNQHQVHFWVLYALCDSVILIHQYLIQLPFLSLQDVDVNLIITDYCMPGMTGYDLLKKIKVSYKAQNHYNPANHLGLLKLVHHLSY